MYCLSGTNYLTNPAQEIVLPLFSASGHYIPGLKRDSSKYQSFFKWKQQLSWILEKFKLVYPVYLRAHWSADEWNDSAPRLEIWKGSALTASGNAAAIIVVVVVTVVVFVVAISISVSTSNRIRINGDYVLLVLTDMISSNLFPDKQAPARHSTNVSAVMFLRLTSEL